MTLAGVLEHTVPASFFEAAAKNEVLQVVFFSVLFAAALAMVKAGRPKDTCSAFHEGLAEVMFKFTGIVMKFAPIGIFGAVTATIGKNGLEVLFGLGKLVGTLYLAPDRLRPGRAGAGGCCSPGCRSGTSGST